MVDTAARTRTKIAWRILPLIMFIAILNYLDRANIAFAALQMNKDLGFTASVYGFGAGIFFIGYCLFEIPSNLIMSRVGARIWLSRIMVTWGIIATATAWIGGETSFYVMRFLLGVAEAGFLPAIMYYCRSWFPAESRGKILGIFMSHTAIANIIGGPLAAALMGTFDGAFGLRGWQMLFIFEGLPSILIGIGLLWWLTEKPADATWLSDAEKSDVTSVLEAEIANQGSRAATTLKEGFLDRRVVLITALCFFLVLSNFGIVFWLPQIVKGLGSLTTMQVGLLTALPYILACIAMILWGMHSDRTADRRWHLFIGGVVGAFGLAGSSVAGSPELAFVGLCVGAMGIWSMFGVFWATPADFLSGMAAASGLALINSIGTVGGFVGPFVVGIVRDQTGSFTASLLTLAGSALIAASLALLLRNEWRREVRNSAVAAEVLMAKRA